MASSDSSAAEVKMEQAADTTTGASGPDDGRADGITTNKPEQLSAMSEAVADMPDAGPIVTSDGTAALHSRTDSEAMDVKMEDPATVWKKSNQALRMEARIAKDKYDVDAWATLLQEAQQQPPEAFRPTFEACVEALPFAAAVWHTWLLAEIRAQQAVQVESLFERCLLRCRHVELWQLYLRYVHGKGANREQLVAAYELLLEAVGADPASGALWAEYAMLTRAGIEAGHPKMAMQIAATRAAYHRALTAAVAGVAPLLKEYEEWEASVSGAAAKSVVAEVADLAQVSNRAGRERLALYDPLRVVTTNAQLRLPVGTPSHMLLSAWAQLWAYEAKNAQRLSPPQHLARMQFAFAHASLALWRCPQMWNEVACWMASHGHSEAARDAWRRALEVLPTHPLLLLASARHEEGDGNLEEARFQLEKLIEASPKAVHYIARLRLAWRTQTAADARKVFARARRAATCSWHVYAAAAELEFQHARDAADGADVAARIFTLAVERFPASGQLALYYAKFLLSVRDLANLRALLEEALQEVPAAERLPLWDFYARVECRFGSASAAASVCARRAAAFPETRSDALMLLTSQYEFEGLWPNDVVEASADGEGKLAARKGSSAGARGAAADAAGGASHKGGSGAKHFDPKQDVAAGVTSFSTLSTGAELEALRGRLLSSLPPEIAGWLAALPPASALGNLHPTPNDVKLLCERLAQVPDAEEDMLWDVVYDGADGARAKRSQGRHALDAYSARHKKAKAPPTQLE